MEIIKIPVGYLEANCYIVFDKNSKDAVIIDPGSDAEKILSEVDKENLKPLSLINTHNHFDHIGANKIIAEKLKIERFIPTKDEEIKKFGTLVIKFLFTPGHTRDGICLLVENHLFSGDTLFAGCVGRTDLGDGNFNQLLCSIKTKVLTLQEETIVHPGHGCDTTLGREKRHNPFLQMVR